MHPEVLSLALGAARRAARGIAVIAVALVIDVAGAAALVSSAHAQVYVQSERAETYVPLARRGVTTTDFAFSARDEGVATLTLPFPFRFIGADQSSVWMSVNGVLQFGSGARPTFSNQGIASAPAGVIAAWWDDLIVPGTSGHARHGVVGTAPNRAFVIEYENWERYGLFGLNDGAFQVWLHEGARGRFEVRYDRALTASENYSATVGYRSVDGATAGSFRPCGASADCDDVDYAGLTGRVVQVQLVDTVELVGEFGSVPRGALPGTSVSVPVVVRNLGPQPAAASQSVLRLSADDRIDASDIVLARVSVPAIAAQSARNLTVLAAVPASVAPSDDFLLLEVDSGQVIAEAIETNNVVVSATRFATATELAVASVTAPSGGNQGDAVSVPVTVTNVGVARSGPATLEVRASLDQLFQSTDPVLATTQVLLSGARRQTFTILGTYPRLTPGLYRAIARVDPDDLITEIEETNNLRVSAANFPSGADLVPTALMGPSGASAGDGVSFALTVDNLGVAYSGPVQVALKLSPNALHDVTDPVIATVTVDAAGQRSQAFTVAATLPASLPNRRYYPIAAIDPANRISEISDGNNGFVSLSPIRVGPDFTVTDVQGALRGVPGDMVTITTDVASAGAPYTGAVGYALYLSADDALDAQDVELGRFSAIVSGAGVSDTRSVVLPAAAVGDLTAIARVDPAGAISEADEQNNVYVAPAAGVFGADLRVTVDSFAPSAVEPAGAFDYTGTLRVDTNPLAANVDYRVVLSADARLDATDRTVGSGTAPVAGQSTVGLSGTVDLSRVIPPVAPSEYEVIIEVDPRDAIAERREDNNADDGSGELIVRGPNLLADEVTSGDQAFVGNVFEVSMVLRNEGDGPSGEVAYEYLMAREGLLANGFAIGRGRVGDLAPGAAAVVTDRLTLASTLSPGPVVLGVVVDPDDAIDERDERDNQQVRAGVIQLRAPVADLSGRLLGSSTVAAAGEEMSVIVDLRNTGFAAASDFTYAYVLTDPAGADVSLGRFTTSLDVDDRLRLVEVVSVPETVGAGAYEVAVVVDPLDERSEVDETNNRSPGRPIRLTAPDLRVATERLPEARLGLEYGTTLRAVGGVFSRRWRVASGDLPPGVTLSAGGALAGTPARDGLFTFAAEVASGERTAQRTLRLAVSAGEVDFAIVESALPFGYVGLPYLGGVVTVGGFDPISWTADGLPAGLTIEAGGGIAGFADAEGECDVRFSAVDATGAVAEATLRLRILEAPSALRVATGALPAAIVGQPYCGVESVRLFANGGVPPHTWTATGVPDGLSLDGAGRLCGTPTETGRALVVATVTDATGQLDTAGLPIDVRSAESVFIRTLRLPPATVNAAYEATVEAAGGAPPYAWETDFGLLPPGMNFSSDGRISGRTAAPGLYAFAVRVVDAQGSSAIRALSVEVVAPSAPIDAGGGCRCAVPRSNAGATPAAAAVPLAALVGLRARRRRRREEGRSGQVT